MPQSYQTDAKHTIFCDKSGFGLVNGEVGSVKYAVFTLKEC